MKKWILILLLPAIAHLAYTQNYIPEVRTFTTEDGLSSNEIFDIHKDARGFMWIGTQNGLNRFDGRTFKTYSKETFPDLDFNIINDIMEDQEGNLWLVKSQEKYQFAFSTIAINLFNIYTEEIETLGEHFGEDLPFADADVTFLKQLDDGSIFIYCEKKKEAFSFLSEIGFQSIPFPKDITSLRNVSLTNNDHFIIAGIHKNLDFQIFKINQKGEILKSRFFGMEWNIQDKDQNISFETWGEWNLTAYQHFSPDLEKLSNKPSKEPSNNIILQTDFNRTQQLFWLRNGPYLKVVTLEGKIVYKHKSIDENLGRMPILFEGETTWFSNKKDGLVALTLKPNFFQTNRFFENPIHNSLRGIIKDKTGSLWFSTVYGTGQMNSNVEFSIIKLDNGFSRFLEDKEGSIWYYDNGDLVRHNPKTQEEANFHLGLTAHLWSIFEADNGQLWLGFGQKNFYTFNPETGKLSQKNIFQKEEKNNFFIYDFQKRDEQSVWICTSQGLFIVDLEGEVIAKFDANQRGGSYVPAKDIRHLYQGKDNEVWLATGNNGLIELKNKNEKLKIGRHFTTSNGLSSNSLHAIYKDDFGYLWISSDDGLMQLDLKTEQITKYFKSDGIAHDEFNRIAHFQGDDGQLYFGGINGLTVFNPKYFSNSRDKIDLSKLVITDFQQFSGEKKTFENLTTSLLQTNQIILQSDDQFFKLNLAILDFKNGKNSVFNYRIKGLYDWQSTKNNELGISGLPYGKHILEINAQNGNRQNVANTLGIPIQVLRPFYLQWWFITLSLASVGLGIWLFFQKRTQRVVAQQEAQQLKDLDKMKSRFFANISHELRTPLTLIGLPLKHLMKNYQQFSDAEILKYLQSAHSNKEDLNRLINEILDLSKLEAGKLQLENKSIRLYDFLKRVVDVFETSAATKDIDFRFSSKVDKEVVVQLDNGKLEMIINNLLSNALKFTAEKGVINVTAEWTNNNELLFQVEDNGRGIHADDLPQVFERYFQSHQNSNNDRELLEGGSGIGLAICKEFIELMNGNIQAQSELKKGSTFRFNLPLEKIETKEQQPTLEITKTAKTSSVDSITPAPFPKNKQTILIVEDHDELRQYLQNILSPIYNIQTASNGKKALELLPTANCQLILSDVMMPEMDGFTFLKKVKADNQFCGIPFILLTARAEIQDKLQGLRIGVDAYMTKPFEVEELLLRVENLLDNAQNRKFIELPNSSESKKEKTKTKEPSNYQPAKEDIEWLQQVESIALREIQNKEFVMEDLSKELLLGHRSMHRKIKQITGLTPNRYIRSIRLHQAKQILETREVVTLKEVAFTVGFEGLTHFSRLFEAEFGKRPQDYLKQQEV